MNPRHRNNNLSHIETQTLLLLDFVVNKATQSRRLVQQSALVELTINKEYDEIRKI